MCSYLLTLPPHTLWIRGLLLPTMTIDPPFRPLYSLLPNVYCTWKAAVYPDDRLRS